MKGHLSPISYDATGVEIASKIVSLPASKDDMFGRKESFAVSFGDQESNDVNLFLTRDQLHALKHAVDKACGEYPLQETSSAAS
jgi:hypothetical protein